MNYVLLFYSIFSGGRELLNATAHCGCSGNHASLCSDCCLSKLSHSEAAEGNPTKQALRYRIVMEGWKLRRMSGCLGCDGIKMEVCVCVYACSKQSKQVPAKGGGDGMKVSRGGFEFRKKPIFSFFIEPCRLDHDSFKF